MRLLHLAPFGTAIALVAVWLAPARSELRVAEPVIDLGVIRGGQKLTHTFTVRNPGSAPLEIVELQRGCGCLNVRADKLRLESGDKAMLTLELRTLGQAEGPHTWNLLVHYRAGTEAKQLTLALRGVIRSEIVVEPALLGMHVTKSVQQEVTLTDRRATPLKVLHAEVRTPGLRVTSIQRDGKTTKIVLSAEGNQLAPGRHEGMLTLTTDDADYEQLQIPVTITKDAATTIRAVPDLVSLRLPAGTAMAATALVRLRSNAAESVRIARTEASDSSLSVTWASGPGNDATMKIQAKSGGGPVTKTASVRVHFTEPAGATLTVPVEIVLDK